MSVYVPPTVPRRDGKSVRQLTEGETDRPGLAVMAELGRDIAAAQVHQAPASDFDDVLERLAASEAELSRRAEAELHAELRRAMSPEERALYSTINPPRARGRFTKSV